MTLECESFPAIMHNAILYSAELGALTATLVLLFGRCIPARVAWSLVAFGFMAIVIDAARYDGTDYLIFREVGRAILAGHNPFQPEEFVQHPFGNPPSAFPLFALFGLMPARLGFGFWMALNVVGAMLLGPLASRLLSAHEGAAPEVLPSSSAWLLGVAVAISFASRYCIELGQLAILVALAITAALIAQDKGRPLWAGFFLALSTVKIHTSLPFLVFFLRKRDLLTWIFLIIFAISTILLTLPISELPRTVHDLKEGVGRLDRTVNSYEFSNSSSSEIISIGHLLYRLGLRNRMAINSFQCLILGIVGILLAQRIVRRGGQDRNTCVSLVALYAQLFLYHRVYDSVLLVIPLLLCVFRAARSAGASRAGYIGCGLACLSVLYLRVGLLSRLTLRSLSMGSAGWLLQGVVLAYADWAIIFAFFLLWSLSRDGRPSASFADG